MSIYKRRGSEMSIDQYKIDVLMNCVKNNTNVCDVCGKAIIPDVRLKPDGTIGVVTTESAGIRGAYNKRLKRVCTECAKAMSLQKDVEPAYKFCDILNYKSPIKKGLKTKCVFIRKEGHKAVVMFAHAEFAARVGFCQLEKCEDI